MSDDFRDFPVAADRAPGHKADTRFHARGIRGQAVFSDRMATGFGGVMVVTIILLVVRLLAGVKALPL
jgi:hypothetical protein